jgi:adenosylhomocysteine nucleosidase
MKSFVIAMQKEAQPIIDVMADVQETYISGKKIILGNLFDREVAIVICGVGKVNAACGAQIAIDRLGADEVINIGVAGGLNNSLKVADIYGISSVVQYDFDLTQLNGTAIGTLDECTENYLPLTPSSIFENKKLGTGDRFNDSKADFELLTKTLSADVRDMECGAIAQVCMHAKIKCRSYKIISDLAGSGSTTEQYLKNLKVCFENLSTKLEKLVREIYG